MKIALVARHVSAPATPSDPYAAEQAAHVAGLGRALAAQGHSVVIYARKDAPGLPDRETLAPGPDRALHQGRAAGARFRRRAAAVRRRDRQVPRSPMEEGHAGHRARAPLDQRPGRPARRPRGAGADRASFGSLGTAEQRHGVPGPQDSARIRMEDGVARSVDRRAGAHLRRGRRAGRARRSRSRGSGSCRAAWTPPSSIRRARRPSATVSSGCCTSARWPAIRGSTGSSGRWPTCQEPSWSSPAVPTRTTWTPTSPTRSSAS